MILILITDFLIDLEPIIMQVKILIFIDINKQTKKKDISLTEFENTR